MLIYSLEVSLYCGVFLILKYKGKIFLKIGLFVSVFLLVLVSLNKLFQPAWLDWNNYYTIHGFYEEPKDTIETVFLGSSVMVSAIAPTELYDEYGLSTYNLATEQQPMIASYYWLEEVYHLHSNTLKTVVLDVSQLRFEVRDVSYRIATDPMKFSAAKLRSVLDYTKEDLSEVSSYLFQLILYHDRWNSLTEKDFQKSEIDPVNGMRGYYFTSVDPYCSTKVYADFMPVSQKVLYGLSTDEEVGKAEFQSDSVRYLEKMIKFCAEKQIKLVLIKTPQENWNNLHHNAVQDLAKKNKVDFLDFNCVSLMNNVSYMMPFDSMDGSHTNYFGMKKLTHWIGNYLVEECNGTDIRNTPRYAYLEEQRNQYHETVDQIVGLRTATDISQYLKAALMGGGDNTILIVAGDEASHSLTNMQREYFNSIGLKTLAQIESRDSYLSVIDNGTIVIEQTKKDKEIQDQIPITYTDTVNSQKNLSFTLTSGGFNHGHVASIRIDGSEYVERVRGLNIVVYSNTQDKVIDSAVFDTFASSYRECYNLDSVEIASQTVDLQITKDITEYLKSALNGKNTVFIAVSDDASSSLTDDQRTYFKSIGLEGLSEIQSRDSYLAVIEGSDVVHERRKDGSDVRDATPISFTGTLNHALEISLVSGGFNHGWRASIKIDGIEYAENKRGLNVVVYSNQYDQVIDTTVFDTWASSMREPYRLDESKINNDSSLLDQIKYFLIKQREL